MKSTFLYLITGIFLLFTFTQCNTVSTDNAPDNQIELLKPQLISPTQKATNQSTSVDLSWKVIRGADEYRLQISEVQDFSSTTVDTLVTGTNYTATTVAPSTTYYWRVQAIKRIGNNNQAHSVGPWSDTWTFTTGSGQTDTVSVSLLSPTDGETVTTTSPKFDWDSLSVASDYHFQLSKTSDYTTLVTDSVVNLSSVQVSGLENGVQYHWRVLPIVDNMTGKWSASFQFTVDAGTSGTPAVTLTSPSDGATGLSTSLTLNWEALAGISNYQLQVATSGDFSSPTVDQTVSNTSYDLTGLANSQTYYWRVQAAGDGDTGNWSAIFQFTTQASTQPATGTDSRSGDEAALEALYAAANGSGWTNNSGWSSSGMSLSNNIYGVTVATINGELRVTQIDLHNNGLSGSIDVPEIGNLKQMKLFTVTFNSLHSTIPAELGSCTNLQYLYLSRSDYVAQRDTYPHIEAQSGGGDVHVGKSKGSEQNIFTGAVPAELGNLKQLKWFILNWTDSAVGATDGISSVPVELFNITTLEGLQIYDNNGVADMPFPDGITRMTNLDNLALGVEKGGNKTGWVTGSIPGAFGQLTNLRFVRLNENVHLTLDFDQVDLSGMTSLRNFDVPFIDVKGTFPAYFVDGTLPNLVAFNLNFPQNSTGLTGTLSAGSRGMTVINVGYGNSISGSIPSQFWKDNSGLINTEFHGDDLTSIGTTDLTNLTRIRNLRWANNNIGPEKWPNLAWGTSQLRDFARADFSGNRYVFADMLWKPSNGGGRTIFELYQANAESQFNYGNQQPFGRSRTISISAGSDLAINDFDGVVTHPDNVYQWQKDGSNISGATSRDLSLSSISTSAAGTYRLVVTNPGVPGLTLTSQPIKVTVN